MPLSNLTTDGKTDAEHLVREFSVLAKSRQMILCHLYEDSDYVVLALTKAAIIEQARQAALEAGGELNVI